MSVGIGGFNTGIQRQIVVIDNVTSLQVDFGGDILDLDASEYKTKIEVKPISTQGYVKRKYAWEGWHGNITVARNNGNGDKFEAAQELLYHTGGGQHTFTIEETTTNDDGSVDVFQYLDVIFSMPSAGQAKMDSAVEPKFEWEASSRQPLT